MKKFSKLLWVFATSWLACTGEHTQTKEDITSAEETELVENTPSETDTVNYPQRNHEYAKCGELHRQSPINIMVPPTKKAHKIAFNYMKSHEVVENLGHTVELLYDKGSTVNYDGEEYNLIQFHFHTPSEHHIDEQAYPMEMHMVHQGEDSTYLVVALLFTEGEANDFLAGFIPDIPKEEGEESSMKTIDLKQLLPEKKEFFTYSGSLTTPPYTEGVKWVLFKEPVTCTSEQIGSFRQVEGFNARDTQALNHREVDEFSGD